jgi:hypothetical protein
MRTLAFRCVVDVTAGNSSSRRCDIDPVFLRSGPLSTFTACLIAILLPMTLSNVDIPYVLGKNPSCVVIIEAGLKESPQGGMGAYSLYRKILDDLQFHRTYSYLEEDQLLPGYVYQVSCDHAVIQRALSNQSGLLH